MGWSPARLPRPAASSSIANQIKRPSNIPRDYFRKKDFRTIFHANLPSDSVKAYIFRPHRSRRAFLFAVSSIGVPYQPCCRCIRYAIRPVSVKRTCLFDSSIGGLAWGESHTSPSLLSFKPLTGISGFANFISINVPGKLCLLLIVH